MRRLRVSTGLACIDGCRLLSKERRPLFCAKIPPASQSSPVAVLPFSNNRCVSQNRRANIEKLLVGLLAVYDHFSKPKLQNMRATLETENGTYCNNGINIFR